MIFYLRKMLPDRNRPWKDYGFPDVDTMGRVEQTFTCPECSEYRSKAHRRTKCCSVNVEQGVWHCHHCGASGYVPSEAQIKARTARQRRIEAERDRVPEKGKFVRPKAPRPPKGACRSDEGQAKRMNEMNCSDNVSMEDVVCGMMDDESGKLSDKERIALLPNEIYRQVLTYLTEERKFTLDVLARSPLSIVTLRGSAASSNGGLARPDGTPPSGVGGLCFLYYDHKVLINQKTRKMDKTFWMHKGAEIIPYNIDAIMRKRVCYITEGEFDVISLMQAGFPESISVPTGGSSTNLDWLDRFAVTHFDDKEVIYVCTDNDEVGYKMMKELVRRLGGYRCMIVLWDEGCKDANEELQRHGEEGIRRCIASARSVPDYGVETVRTPHVERELDDLFANGIGKGAEIGIKCVDHLITYETGRFMLVTGRPGDGKSEFLDEICLRLALYHGWKTAYFSPENFPLKYHLAKLISKLSGYAFKKSGSMTDELYETCKEWLSQNMCHIMPGGGDDEEYDHVVDFTDKVDIGKLLSDDIARTETFTLNQVLTVAREAVVRRGVRILVLDPLNSIMRDEEDKVLSDLDWDLEVCNRLLAFAHANDVLVILVAHPRKVDRATMTNAKRRVEMNDINGSSKFGAKCDYCLVIDRDDELQVVNAYVDKVKFKHLGTRGSTTLHYDCTSGRYVPCEVKRLTKNEAEGYAQNGVPRGSELFATERGSYLKTVDWRWFNRRWVDPPPGPLPLNREGE